MLLKYNVGSNLNLTTDFNSLSFSFSAIETNGGPYSSFPGVELTDLCHTQQVLAHQYGRRREHAGWTCQVDSDFLRINCHIGLWTVRPWIFIENSLIDWSLKNQFSNWYDKMYSQWLISTTAWGWGPLTYLNSRHVITYIKIFFNAEIQSVYNWLSFRWF